MMAGIYRRAFQPRPSFPSFPSPSSPWRRTSARDQPLAHTPATVFPLVLAHVRSPAWTSDDGRRIERFPHHFPAISQPGHRFSNPNPRGTLAHAAARAEQPAVRVMGRDFGPTSNAAQTSAAQVAPPSEPPTHCLARCASRRMRPVPPCGARCLPAFPHPDTPHSRSHGGWIGCSSKSTAAAFRSGLAQLLTFLLARGARSFPAQKTAARSR